MLSIIVKMTGEFTSMEEPTDDSDIAIVVVFPADGKAIEWALLAIPLSPCVTNGLCTLSVTFLFSHDLVATIGTEDLRTIGSNWALEEMEARGRR
jgi:hypothetical protein